PSARRTSNAICAGHRTCAATSRPPPPAGCRCSSASTGSRVLHVEARQPAAPCAAPDGIRAYPHVPLAAQIVVTAPSYDHLVLHDTFGAECARCGCRVAPRRNGPAPTGGV